MPLLIYNTLSRSKEEFKPLIDNNVRMFVCGQTVYDDAHLGHAKNYINFDIVVRWLRHSGYTVKYIQNITDVDDKIIRRAEEQHKDPVALAREYESRFMEDMDAIGVKQSVDQYPRSHDYIEEITHQIQLLLDKGYAYKVEGDIYYDVSKFGNYTKLSGMDLAELEKHRIEPREGKRNSYDFALWKGSKPGEPSWDIELSIAGNKTSISGRPGWHIEDTAITHAIFGPQYDLHGGAIELIFPHHTNEIAQAEAAFGVAPFVKYWMHSGVMLIKGEKMSKSLRNFIRIRDLLRQYDPEALRLLIASAHYRKDIGYTESLIKSASARLNYLRASFSIFYNMPESPSGDGAEVDMAVSKMEPEFKAAMDDDFNTPLALASFSAAIDSLRAFAETHQSIPSETKQRAIKSMLDHAYLFGIFKKDSYKERLGEKELSLIKERERLRKDKKFSDADRIREQLKNEYSVIVEDSEYGTIWYKSA